MPSVLDPARELEEIRGVVPLEGATVLEIGCGEGRLTQAIAPLAGSLTAIDPSAEQVERARAAVAGADFHVAGAVEFDGPASEFDLVLFSWSL